MINDTALRSSVSLEMQAAASQSQGDTGTETAGLPGGGFLFSALLSLRCLLHATPKGASTD